MPTTKVKTPIQHGWRYVASRPIVLSDDAAAGAVAAGGVAPEASADGKRRSWIMMLPLGTYHSAQYGEIEVTPKLLGELVTHFDEHARRIDVALDVDHDGGAATGWIESVEVRDAGCDGDPDTPAGLWGLVRWTPRGVQLLGDEIYRYFSVEFGPMLDPVSGKTIENVILGGGLTNRPVMKTMPAVHLAVHLSEDERERRKEQMRMADGVKVSRTPWSQIDKSMLPASCYLIVGDRAKKTTWRLPVYEGAGPKDAEGCYTQRGALNINAVRAALDAIGGARSGKPMAGVSAAVKARLEGWMKRYGAQGSSASSGGAGSGSGKTAASETRGAARGGMMPTKGKKAGGKPAGEHGKNEQELALMTFGEEDEEPEDVEGEEEGAGEGGDETELAEGGEDGAGEGKSDPGDEDEEAQVDAKADRHPQMTTKGRGHAHGRYAMHAHDGDADHSDAPLKADEMAYSGKGGSMASKKAPTKASEHEGQDGAISLAEARALREQVRALREEQAQYRYRLRETDVEKTIEGWGHNTYRFRETAKGPVKRGKIALSKAFADAYREFKLRGAGLKLSEGDDAKFDELVELALSVAIVDLERRSPGSRDTEKRRTMRASEHAGGAGTGGDEESADVRLQERAEELAVELHEGKQLSELSYAQQMALYDKAAHEIAR